MTNTEYYILATFVAMLFFIKNYYDKYSSSTVLIKNFIKEIDRLNKQIENLASLKISLEAKTTALQTSKSSATDMIGQLKKEISQLQTNFNLDKDLIKKDFQLKLKESVAEARKDALKKSRSVLRGQASEHLAPYVIPNTNPKDYRFMGNPIDYICFEGLSDLLDNKSNEIVSIKFVDIKTGKSSLNKSQRRIRDAINENKVSFELINLDEVMNNDKIINEQKGKSIKES
jgi:predicted Holliday junction resolvase-like endonuclease